MTVSTYINMFGDETFAETWIIITDSNDCDIHVTVEDLMEEELIDKYNYVKVWYYGKSWWISKNIHFPL